MQSKKVYLASYYVAHKDNLKASMLAYYRTHKREFKARFDAYRKKNPEAVALLGAKYRCTRPSHPQYKNYGGRGIKFDLTLSELLNRIGRRPSSAYSLDRINNDGNYEINNIRWATRREQSFNKRKNTFCGKGHEFKGRNIRIRKNGWRICVKCTLEYATIRRAEKKLLAEAA